MIPQVRVLAKLRWLWCWLVGHRLAPKAPNHANRYCDRCGFFPLDDEGRKL